jgi:hypothetical protein
VGIYEVGWHEASRVGRVEVDASQPITD